jgi:oxygen-independent coproporphyrinogen-3 oxidase
MPPTEYVELVEEEIRQRRSFFPPQPLDTLYFGGGTPSLLPPEELQRIIVALRENGFPITEKTEVTIEVNPGTLNAQVLEGYRRVGFNRFSIGCQTLNDELLKKLGREHSAEDTRRTLGLLREAGVSFSVDLLFALPHQTMEILDSDITGLLQFKPQHISPYCLTVHEKHVLEPHRPEEGAQVEMFDLIDQRLLEVGFSQYEISNYGLPGFESRHNTIYWSDESYWGIGLSSHSYKKAPGWGTRFWNPRSIEDYSALIQSQRGEQRSSPEACLPKDHWESLEPWEALTDFFHTSLRRAEGVSLQAVEQKFGSYGQNEYNSSITLLVERGLLKPIDSNRFSLSHQGRVLSNLVFRELTFSPPL